MKKKTLFLLLVIGMLFISAEVFSQCAMCTKTAAQLGEKPAKGLNNAIVYLMTIPYGIVGFIAYRWWRSNRTKPAE